MGSEVGRVLQSSRKITDYQEGRGILCTPQLKSSSAEFLVA